MPSKCTEVRRALIDGIASRLGGLSGFSSGEDEVEVRYAYSFAAQTAQQVYTGRSHAQTPGAALRGGRNVRTEQGEFEVVVRVELAGRDPSEADDRVDEIGAELEAFVDARKSDQLGVGLTSLRITAWSGDYYGVDGGSGSIRSYTVAYSARIDS